MADDVMEVKYCFYCPSMPTSTQNLLRVRLHENTIFMCSTHWDEWIQDNADNILQSNVKFDEFIKPTHPFITGLVVQTPNKEFQFKEKE